MKGRFLGKKKHSFRAKKTSFIKMGCNLCLEDTNAIFANDITRGYSVIVSLPRI